MRTFLFIVLFNSLCNAGLLFKGFGFAVSQRRERKQKKSDIPRLILPTDYGNEYKDVYAAIARSRQVVTFRRQNSTVVGYVSSENNSGLEVSVGCNPIHSLLPVDSKSNLKHYVLLSGIVGDCRAAVRHLKQVALNHTFAFDSPPTGEYLANKLSSFLDSNRDRKYAVHAYILSTAAKEARRTSEDGHCSATSGCIYEVGATGSVMRVRGGTVGGAHVEKARRHLEEHYRGDLTEEECRVLVSELFDTQLDDLDVDREEHSTGEEVRHIAKPKFTFVEIFDT